MNTPNPTPPSSSTDATKIVMRTFDAEWPDLLQNRVEKRIEPQLAKLDTVNKEYLITIEITEIP